ncbi:MAG: TRAP transporter small permease [Acetobacteraceae bacterium]|nr:TRAP transporter small permease [Acetobacteraceae bacterium]
MLDRASDAYLRISNRVVQAGSVLALGAMVAINAVNIVSRGAIHVDMEWTQEISVLLAMVIYFFSFALISKQNSEIRIDFIVHALPPAWQRALGLLSRCSVFAFQAVVLWCAIMTLGFVRIFRTPVLELSEALFFIPVIAGAADILITELIYLRRQSQGRIGLPGAGLPSA